MPAKTNSAKSGSKRSFRTTDKCVQAEMKNKVCISIYYQISTNCGYICIILNLNIYVIL